MVGSLSFPTYVSLLTQEMLNCAKASIVGVLVVQVDINVRFFSKKEDDIKCSSEESRCKSLSDECLDKLDYFLGTGDASSVGLSVCWRRYHFDCLRGDVVPPYVLHNTNTASNGI